MVENRFTLNAFTTNQNKNALTFGSHNPLKRMLQTPVQGADGLQPRINPNELPMIGK